MWLASSKKSIMLFLAQTAPSRGTLPRSSCEGAPQRMSKQNSARSYRCRGVNKFSFCHHSFLRIWGKTLRETLLTITLNMRAVNVILIMLCLITISGSESVLDKSSCEEMSEISWWNPVQDEKKKFPGKGGPNLTTTTNIIMYDFISSNISLNSW